MRIDTIRGCCIENIILLDAMSLEHKKIIITLIRIQTVEVTYSRFTSNARKSRL